MKKTDYQSFSFNLTIPCVREGAGEKCLTPKDVAELVSDTKKLAQESFTVLTMTKKNTVIDRHLVGLGIIDSAVVHPREVFRVAIADGAYAVILSHNHPSGDCEPSAEDIKITRQLVEAGKIIGINVLDHVIIGRGERPFCSLRESGLVAFE